MERMLRSRQEISEMKLCLGIIPYMDRTLGLQPEASFATCASPMKRDMVNLIETDEVRERVVFSCWKNQGKIHNG